MMTNPTDGINWLAHARIQKYSPDQVTFATSKNYGIEPKGDLLVKLINSDPEDGILEVPGNLLVTVGLNLITSLIIGAGGQALSHAAALTGVGDSTTAATVGDTQLGSNSTGHSRYIIADTGYPSQSNGVITMQSTFGTSDANFAWNEWGWVSAATATDSDTFAACGTSPILINHKIAALGTKASGASWVFQTTVTLS